LYCFCQLFDTNTIGVSRQVRAPSHPANPSCPRCRNAASRTTPVLLPHPPLRPPSAHASALFLRRTSHTC
jgi:hypothetical protein